MLTLFALGSVGFWALLGLETIVLLVLIEYERPWLGTFSLIVTGLVVHFLCGINLVQLVSTNPGTSALVGAGYFVAGTVWSTVKWFLYVLKKKEEYLEAKALHDPVNEAIYRQSYHDKDRTPDPIPWEKAQVRRRFLNSKGELPPLVRDNKERIMLWMVYWPWSAVWTIINDPVKRLFNHIYNLIQARLQAISNRVFADVK